MNFQVLLTEQAEKDIRNIFEYVADELKSVQNATGQIFRLEENILALNTMPDRFRVYDKEPWRSRGLRIMAVDNYIFFIFQTMRLKQLRLFV